jgi:exosome complex exonuclease RRP6
MADHPLSALLNQLQQAIVPPTQAASSLPSSSDLAFERTLSRKLNRSLDTEAERILSLASRVLNWAAPPPPSLKNNSDLDSDLIKEGVYNSVVTRIEPLLEHADDSIDRHLGVGKHRQNPNQGAVGAKSAEEMSEREKERMKKDRLPARLLHDSSLEKPQLRFTSRTALPRPKVEDESANGEGGIPLWKPVLRNKVNALAASSADEANEGEGWLRTELYEPSSSMSLTTSTNPPPYTRYIHPYTDELAALRPPPSFLEKPEKPKAHAKDSFDKTPFEWVDDEKALEKMIGEIREAGEKGSKDLAIDLEHHDFRTWGGMTCLIQVRRRFLLSLRQISSFR